MVRLSRAVFEVLIEEFGPAECLRRLADPVWFQAFGSLLGFDWHSSGLTTVTTAALKEGMAGRMAENGLWIAGGKGKASRKTPDEILVGAEALAMAEQATPLADWSRLVAKVDNTALQDGYQLYHHVFFFTADGHWAVVQQGMPSQGGVMARRYHWWSEDAQDPVNEPRTGIAGDEAATDLVMDMTASISADARVATGKLLREVPVGEVHRALDTIRLTLPAGHSVPNARYLDGALHRLYQRPPDDFQDLLVQPGVGPGSLRALVMTAELIYGVEASRVDPVRYSFAHGGKDGHPYPVDRAAHDHTASTLEQALYRARVGHTDQLQALKRLAAWTADQKELPRDENP